VAFRGTFDYSLDAKNRLTVPSKFRASLSGGVVLAKGVERCVELWPPAAFEGYTQAALADMHELSPHARKLRRYFMANSMDTELDSAGRVMLPSFLLEHAGLRKEVVVTGIDDHLEIWDRSAWADYNAALADDVTEITEGLGHPG
jgi:MraZ protein